MKPEELKFNFPYQFSKITGYEGAIIVKWGAHLDYVKYLEERLKYFMESNETIVVQLTAEVRRREAAEYYILVRDDDRYSMAEEIDALEKWQSIVQQEGR